MNILLWILGYLFIGLLYGNIKWKLVYFTEQAKNGDWMKNPIFWFFFPWRTFLNAYSKPCCKSFTHARPEIIAGFDELQIDKDHRNLHCYLILTIIFWGIPLTWSVASILFLIPVSYILYHVCERIIFPAIMVLLIKPTSLLYNYTTCKLFQNCPKVVMDEDD